MSSLGDGFHRLRPYYQELRHGTAYLAFAMIVVIWLGALFHLISARDQLFDSIRQNSANLAHAFEQDVVHSLSEVRHVVESFEVDDKDRGIAATR